jgi:hypothetical protein
MGATIEQEKSGVWVVHISGALRKEDMDAIQGEGLKGMEPHQQARVLVMVEPDFSGWVGSEVWNDMTFFVKYGNSISKIAVVGDPKWQSRMLMFTGAGFRRTQVKYFAEANGAKDAYAWLG